MKKSLAALFLCASIAPLMADVPAVENPMLVHDDGVVTAQSSSPLAIAPLGSGAVFRATMPGTGMELWKSDGTAAGTTLVKDVRPGSGDGVSGALVAVGGADAFFVGNDGVHGPELWHTDGTAAGTKMVKDICPGPCGSYPSSLYAYGTTLIFNAYDPVNGYELWWTDAQGSAHLTELLMDINPGDESSNPGGFVNVAGRLYFAADDGTNGRELWKRDSSLTPAIAMLKDINPGAASSNPHSLVDLDGYLYFLADEAGYGVEPWSSNGFGSGTLRVADIRPGATSGVDINRAEMLIRAGSFTAFLIANDGTYGKELWKVSAFGASRVSDVCPGACDGATEVVGAIGTNALFVGSTAAAGLELWKSNGASASMLADIRPGAANGFSHFLGTAGSNAFFVANDGTHGPDLWKTDGTSTSLVLDINPAGGACNCNRGSAIFGGTFLFSAGTAATGVELWKTNGTGAGTLAVKNIAPDVGGIAPHWIGGIDGNAMFAATTAATGVEVAFSGGRKFAPLVTDVNAGPSSSDPYEFTPVGAKYLFGATAAAYGGIEPWVIGQDGYTLLSSLSDINPTGESIPEEFVDIGGTIFFVANDGLSGRELWKTDGTPSGTALVRDIHGASGYPAQLTKVGATLFFTADNGVDGQELWKSNGTFAGTVLVKNIATGGASSEPEWLTDVNGVLFFTADDGTHGRELWRSDGTAAGTYMVRDIRVGAEGSDPSGIAARDSLALFFADDGINGREIWCSTGASGNANLVYDVRFGPAGSDVGSRLVRFGNWVYFAADNGTNGAELYRARDVAQIGIVTDICSGACSSNPADFTPVGSKLYFTAFDETRGRELWASTGVIPGGTALVADLEPGAVSSSPGDLHGSGNRLYFGAYTSAAGRELWEVCATTVTGFDLQLDTNQPGAGDPFGLKIVPVDASGLEVPCWGSTVRITSSDGAATLPPDQALFAGAFLQTVYPVLATFGAQTLTVTDLANPAVTSSVNLTVRHPVTMTLNVAPNGHSFPGETVVLTAALSSTGGSGMTGVVHFTDFGFPIADGVPVSGAGASLSVSSLGAGPHQFGAYYSGDVTFGPGSALWVPHWRKPSAPAGVIAEAIGTTTVRVTWVPVAEAVEYAIYRTGPSPDNVFTLVNKVIGGTASQFNDTGVIAGKSYRYIVRALDDEGYQSLYTAADLATTILFSDDPLVPGTPIKAAHLTQLQTAVNSVRALAGLAPHPFASVVAGDTIGAEEMKQVRDALAAARVALLIAPVVYQDPTLVPGVTRVRAAHVVAARGGVR